MSIKLPQTAAYTLLCMFLIGVYFSRVYFWCALGNSQLLLVPGQSLSRCCCQLSNNYCSKYIKNKISNWNYKWMGFYSSIFELSWNYDGSRAFLVKSIQRLLCLSVLVFRFLGTRVTVISTILVNVKHKKNQKNWECESLGYVKAKALWRELYQYLLFN